MTNSNEQTNRGCGPMVFLIFAIIYAILPMDLIPDITAPIGWADDFAVLALSIRNLLGSKK